MKKKAAIQPLNPQEVEELILKILSRNRWGLPAERVRKALPPSFRPAREEVAARLEELSSRGRLHAWDPPPGKKPTIPARLYSLEPLVELFRQELVTLLKDQSLTPAQVKKFFPLPVSGHLLPLVDLLLEEGTVKWHPPRKGKRLSLKEPDPAEFLSAEIKKLFDKAERLGFSPAAVLTAVQGRLTREPPEREPSPLSPEDGERIIFRAMVQLKPAAAGGALVSLPDLRQALRGTFPSKESFDRAILRLAQAEKIQLQSHSLPAELNDEERAAMIDNGRGSYFMAVGIRVNQ